MNSEVIKCCGCASTLLATVICLLKFFRSLQGLADSLQPLVDGRRYPRSHPNYANTSAMKFRLISTERPRVAQLSQWNLFTRKILLSLSHYVPWLMTDPPLFDGGEVIQYEIYVLRTRRRSTRSLSRLIRKTWCFLTCCLLRLSIIFYKNPILYVPPPCFFKSIEYKEGENSLEKVKLQFSYPSQSLMFPRVYSFPSNPVFV